MPRHELRQDFGPGGRTNAVCVDIVFQRDGYAVERAAVTLALAAARGKELGFGFLGLGEGEFGRDGNIGVELGIKLVNSGKNELGQLGRREFALPEEFSDLLDGREG